MTDEIQKVSPDSLPEALQELNLDLLCSALEGLLFVHNRPMPFPKIAELLTLSQEQTESLVFRYKSELDLDSKRGLQLVVNDEGAQLATKACISPFLQRLEGQKLVSLSLPALETLSVIALKQPITKAEIEAIRGVNCDGVVSNLLEKKLVYVSGEKQVVGKPRLFSTTQDFLYYFGLKSIKELPIPILDRIDLENEVSEEDARQLGQNISESMGLEDHPE